MGAHLSSKEFLEAVVVGDTGDGRDVGGQRDGRERSPLAFIPADEFGGQIACSAGTILDQIDDITRDGLVLSPQSVDSIGRAEARHGRWTAAGIWMAALMLGWIAWLIL